MAPSPHKATMNLASEISIIIPVYNDSAHIGKSVDTLTDWMHAGKINAEIIIINDGGLDETAKIIEEKSKKYPEIKFLNRPENKGKGASVREGMRAASGEIILFTDADLPYGTKHFKQMIEELKSGTDLIIANRNMLSNITACRQAGHLSPIRHLTHWGFNFLVSRFLYLEFSDTQAGLKGLTKKAADQILPKLKIDRFAFDLELLVKAKRAGLKIKEVPVILENVGKSNISVAKDSLQMLKDILKIYFSV